MIRSLYVTLIGFGLLIQGSIIVQKQDLTEEVIVKGKLKTYENNNIYVNDSSLQEQTQEDTKEDQENTIRFDADLSKIKEVEAEVIEIPLADKLGPPNLNLVNKLKCNLSDVLLKEIEGYKPVVDKIIRFVLHGNFSGKTYDMLAELTDTFGPRMTGSKQLEESIEWVLRKSEQENLENVHTEPFRAPHWVRNNESLFLLYPRRQELNILGLGSSVGTSPEGIIAEIFVVKSFEELESNPDKARGTIVVFNPEWTTYFEMAKYRVEGASRAAKMGAMASLIRSVTPFSINSPHTGWQMYDESTHKIPTACITREDAEMLQRYQDRGERALIHLVMGAQNFPDTLTHNTVSELVGYDLPGEIVVVAGHLDSWDVGVGAMDDGGGSMISWVAPVILRRLGLRPRRTIRTVLFSGEEQGIHGGKAYFEKHSHNKDKFQILLESDIGTFNPFGLSFSGSNEAKCILSRVLALLEPLNTTKLASPMSGGPDITLWENAGVPTGSVLNKNDRYFWFHHSEGDTMSVEDSAVLDKCASLWTSVAYILGDLNITLPR